MSIPNIEVDTSHVGSSMLKRAALQQLEEELGVLS